MRIKLLLFALIAVPFALASAQTQKPIVNQDVIQMVKAGISEATIIKVIETSDATFDTSVSGLVALKEAGVSESVTRTMIERGVNKGAVAANDAIVGLPRDLGVYYKNSQGAWEKFLEARPAKMEFQKSFATRLTGLGSLKYKAIFKGATASLQLQEARPAFYVRVLSGISGINVNEVALWRMEEKKNSREVLVSSLSQTQQSGPKEGSIFFVDISQVGSDVVKIIPKSALEAGEYLLDFGKDQKSYDFGIATGQKNKPE